MKQLADELIGGGLPHPMSSSLLRRWSYHLRFTFQPFYFGINDLSGTIDAWCLDGFAPERNREIWEPALFKAIAEKSNLETTFSTFTSARKVRDGLASAGFEVEKVAGFAKSVNVSRVNSWVTEQLTPGPPPARSTQKVDCYYGSWARRRLDCICFCETQNPGRGL